MAKGGKRGNKRREAPGRPSPVWDKATWLTLSNVRLGVPAFVVAGALHAYPDNAKLSEADVRKLIQDFLSQSL